MRRAWAGPGSFSPFSQLLGLETAKASLLYSMEQGVVQGWVGLDPAEEASVFHRHRSQHEVSVRSVRVEVDADRTTRQDSRGHGLVRVLFY